jgi:hypothetical protein
VTVFSNGVGLVRVWGRPDPCEEARQRRLREAQSQAETAKRDAPKRATNAAE